MGNKGINSNIKGEASNSPFSMHSIQRLKEQIISRHSYYTDHKVIFQILSQITLLLSNFDGFWLRLSIISAMPAWSSGNGIMFFFKKKKRFHYNRSQYNRSDWTGSKLMMDHFSVIMRIWTSAYVTRMVLFSGFKKQYWVSCY